MVDVPAIKIVDDFANREHMDAMRVGERAQVVRLRRQGVQDEEPVEIIAAEEICGTLKVFLAQHYKLDAFRAFRDVWLDRLSAAERISLVEELWDSIASSPEAFTLTDAHRQDLDRRLEQCRDNPKAGSPWEEVKARLQGMTTKSQ